MQVITRQDFTRWLNEDLTLELRAVVQSVNHIRRLEQAQALELADLTSTVSQRIDEVDANISLLEDMVEEQSGS